MGWFIRKSVRMGPLRFNFSKRGMGMSVGGKGFRVGTGPRGPYVAGGRGGLYFRESLAPHQRHHGRAVPARRVVAPPALPGTPGQAGGTVTPAAAVSFVPRVWPWWLLGLLIAGTALGLALTSVWQDGATVLLLVTLIAILALDWRGFTTLNGRIVWQALSRAAKFWLVCAYLFVFPIMMPVYLVFAFRDNRTAMSLAAASQKREIAELEADLGILPPTEGVCRKCARPLQVGAEFCAYCGEPVVQRPRICPVCATATLPDARFCPQCRAPLTPA
jgi:hypothetical protein